MLVNFQYITADQVALLCQTATSTNCDAVKVKVLSILGYIGKMAASRDDSHEVLKVKLDCRSQICCGQTVSTVSLTQFCLINNITLLYVVTRRGIA